MKNYKVIILAMAFSGLLMTISIAQAQVVRTSLAHIEHEIKNGIEYDPGGSIFSLTLLAAVGKRPELNMRNR
jgi:hypothetical protein